MHLPIKAVNILTKSAKLQSDTVVKRLHDLHPSLIDLSLNRIKRLLKKIGNPQKRFPCPIHIAGTNGKGSCLAFLQAICEAANLTVHRYTSPHLVRFSERITVAGKNLPDTKIVALLEECEEANRGQDITFFEITTAAAFLAFSRTKADVTLIETGLGGRFDATNVIERPSLTAITPVAMDHMRFLGNTLDAIAFEKAGILKSAVPAIISKQTDIAQSVINQRAIKIKAPLIVQGHEWDVRSESNGICVIDKNKEIKLPLPALPGLHQHNNAAQAVIIARRIPHHKISEEALAAGIKNAVWPGRMQLITEGNFISQLPKLWKIWIDGGHNAAAAEVISEFCKNWRKQTTIMIFGSINTRDPKAFLERLSFAPSELICIKIPGEASSHSAADCSKAAKALGFKSQEADSIMDAINIATSIAASGNILVCGSLYLAGAFLEQNGTPP